MTVSYQQYCNTVKVIHPLHAFRLFIGSQILSSFKLLSQSATEMPSAGSLLFGSYRATMGFGGAMEKKPAPARLKKKGAYLPQPPAEPASNDNLASGLPNIEAQPAPPAPVIARTYRRRRWKHFMRWVAFLLIVSLDAMVATSTATAFFRATHAASLQTLGKQAIVFIMFVLLNCLVLPSIVMEADEVEVNDDALIVRNLLLKCTLGWDEITAVLTPVYLKFAIIKTKRLFQLINKRDMEDFNQLIQTIRTRTGLTSK